MSADARPGMDDEPTITKRVRVGEADNETGSPKKRQRTTLQAPIDHDDSGGDQYSEHDGQLANEQVAGLASRIDMLEDLLFQLQGEKSSLQQSGAQRVAPLEPAQPLVSEIDAAIQPPPLPDWASRARRLGKKSQRPAVQPTNSNDEDSHEMLEMTLRNLERGSSEEQLSLPHEDDDVLIRGILHGWDSCSRKHRLDKVWRFLRMFDLYLYKLMSPISKLAALRALRTMLLHRMQPCNQAIRPIPNFFEPTELQKRERHSSLIDYFAWPSVRDHLIRHGRDIRSIPRAAQTKFAQNFVFDWPYEFEDAFMTVKATGRFVLSEEFNRRWNDLRYWTITAFDDTNFIPTHLQMDRKKLTACQAAALENERRNLLRTIDDREISADGNPTSSGAILGANRSSIDLPSEQPASSLAHSDPARGSPQITDEGACQETLDEWSWYFNNTHETYETIKSLFEMAVPS